MKWKAKFCSSIQTLVLDSTKKSVSERIENITESDKLHIFTQDRKNPPKKNVLDLRREKKEEIENKYDPNDIRESYKQLIKAQDDLIKNLKINFDKQTTLLDSLLKTFLNPWIKNRFLIFFVIIFLFDHCIGNRCNSILRPMRFPFFKMNAVCREYVQTR